MPIDSQQIDTGRLQELLGVTPPPLDVPESDWKDKVDGFSKKLGEVDEISLSVREALEGKTRVSVINLCGAIKRILCGDDEELLALWESDDAKEVRRRVGSVLRLEVLLEKHESLSDLIDLIKNNDGVLKIANVKEFSRNLQINLINILLIGTKELYGVDDEGYERKLNDNKKILELALSRLSGMDVSIEYVRRRKKVSGKKVVARKTDGEGSRNGEGEGSADPPPNKGDRKSDKTPAVPEGGLSMEKVKEQVTLLGNLSGDLKEVLNAMLSRKRSTIKARITRLENKIDNPDTLDEDIEAKKAEKQRLEEELAKLHSFMEQMQLQLGLSPEKIISAPARKAMQAKAKVIEGLGNELSQLEKLPKLREQLEAIDTILDLATCVSRDLLKILEQLDSL